MKLSFALLFLSVGADGARIGSSAKKAVRQHQQHQPKENGADVDPVNLDMQKELFSSWVAEHKGTRLASAYKNPEELTHRMAIWMQNHGACVAGWIAWPFFFRVSFFPRSIV